MNETLAAIGSILAGILFVLVFILLGWWIVWVCFLSRFKFVRELLGKSSDTDLTDTDGQNPTTQQRRTTGRANARNRIRRD